MCGIGGIVRLGNRPIKRWQLAHMATELQHRGTDATGFALQDEDGTTHVWKVAEPAWKAVAGPAFRAWVDKALTDRARILLVHTRAYTKGSPFNNENNHPLYANPLQGVVVHNGMVRNDDGLFTANEKLGFKRSCGTDSDIFRALLDNWGGIDKGLIKEMGLVEGTAAVAAIHRGSPGKLLLLRDSNPLILGATSDTLAFASTKEALHKVLKPWIHLHNIPMQVHAPDLSFIAMPNETGYIIDTKNGLEAHDVFKCNGRQTGGYVKYVKTPTYFDRQDRAKAEAEREKRASTFSANPTAHVRATVTNPTGMVPAGSTGAHVLTGTSLNSPRLFQFTICPGCSKHVELSNDDRLLASIAYLACKSCGSNLAGGQDADLAVN